MSSTPGLQVESVPVEVPDPTVDKGLDPVREVGDSYRKVEWARNDKK